MGSTASGARKQASLCEPALGAPDDRFLTGSDAEEAVEPDTLTLLRGRAGLQCIADQRARFEATLDPQRLDCFLDWYASYLDALVDDEAAVFFAVVSHGGRIVALLPLRKRRQRMWGLQVITLELLNEPRMPTGDSILTDGSLPDAYLPALLQNLSQQFGRWDCVRLGNLASDCAFALALTGQTAYDRSVVPAGGANSCPVLPQEQVLKRLPRRFARKIRQNRQRLAELACCPAMHCWACSEPERRDAAASQCALFHSATQAADVEQAFEAFLEVEASGWKGEKGSRTALLFDPRLKTFHQHILRRFAQRGCAAIHLLRLAGRPIAGQLAIVSHRTVYLLKIGYDEKHAHLSPGVVLMDYLLRHSATRSSIERIDFTTDMAWQKDWRPDREDMSDFTLFQRTVRGRIAWVQDWLSSRVRSAHQKWVAPWYRRLRGTRTQRYRRAWQRRTAGGQAVERQPMDRIAATDLHNAGVPQDRTQTAERNVS